MKKTLLTIAVIGIVAGVAPAYSWTTNSEYTSVEHMTNYGFSEQTAEITQQQKAKANGEYIEREPYNVNWWRKYVLDYIDPARDRHDYNNHSIKPVSSYSDY